MQTFRIEFSRLPKSKHIRDRRAAHITRLEVTAANIHEAFVAIGGWHPEAAVAYISVRTERTVGDERMDFGRPQYRSSEAIGLRYYRWEPVTHKWRDEASYQRWTQL